MYDKTILNKHAVAFLKKYQNLSIAGVTFPTPFATNMLGLNLRALFKKAELSEEDFKKVNTLTKEHKINFGWYRGKGTPSEIETAAQTLIKRVKLDTSNPTPYGIMEFIKFYNLGIDCSGLTYNILHHVFTNIQKEDELINSFEWPNPEKTGVNYAGSTLFDNNSRMIAFEKLEPLDILIVYRDNADIHVGIVVEMDDEFHIAQSTLYSDPTGVNVTPLGTSEHPFTFKPTLGQDWNELYKDKKILFKRLSIFK